MNIVSTCSGVGALDLVAEDLFGARPAMFADPDPDASAVLADRWPGVPNVGEVTAVPAVAPGSVFTSGWPCQPHAMGGRKLGALDPRAIWSDVADTIDRTRPRVLMLENVAHVCRTGELARVVADLADLGFDAEWTTYRACCAGAPHQRARLFVLAAHSERGGLPPWRVPAPGSGGAAGEERAQLADRADPAGRAGDAARLARWGAHAPAIARWERVTGRPAPAPRVAGARQGPFWEWLMGLPVGHLAAARRHPAMIRLAGNSIVPQAARPAFVELAGRLAVAQVRTSCYSTDMKKLTAAQLAAARKAMNDLPIFDRRTAPIEDYTCSSSVHAQDVPVEFVDELVPSGMHRKVCCADGHVTNGIPVARYRSA